MFKFWTIHSLIEYTWVRIFKKTIVILSKLKIKNGGSKHVFNEKNMKIMRNIFKEELEKQEKNKGNLIRANFKITITNLKTLA